MKAKAVLFVEPGKVSLGEVELSAPEAGEVLLEVLYSCISSGTDLRTLAGKQWGVDEWPFVPGYSQVGRVIQCGEGVSLEEGDLVFSGGTKKCSLPLAWGAHISHAVSPETHVFPLPEGVDPLEASLAKLAAISFHGSLMSRAQPGEQVFVVGLGPIGVLSAVFHRMAGCRVVGLDLSPERVMFVQKAFDMEARVPEESLETTIRQVCPGGPDIVVDSTGSERVLASCLASARTIPWGDHEVKSTRLVIQGSYPGAFSIDYPTAFYKELELILPRDNLPRDLRKVLQFLGEQAISIKPIISQLVPYEEAPEAYRQLQARKGDVLTMALDWRKA